MPDYKVVYRAMIEDPAEPEIRVEFVDGSEAYLDWPRRSWRELLMFVNRGEINLRDIAQKLVNERALQNPGTWRDYPEAAAYYARREKEQQDFLHRLGESQIADALRRGAQSEEKFRHRLHNTANFNYKKVLDSMLAEGKIERFERGGETFLRLRVPTRAVENPKNSGRYKAAIYVYDESVPDNIGKDVTRQFSTKGEAVAWLGQALKQMHWSEDGRSPVSFVVRDMRTGETVETPDHYLDYIS